MKRPKVSIKVIGAGLLILLIAFALGRMTGARRDALKHAKHASTSAKLVKAQTWTCSMHPQIKLPKAGKCPLCGMNLIPLESSSDDEGGLRELSVSENSAKLMEIDQDVVQEYDKRSRHHGFLRSHPQQTDNNGQSVPSRRTPLTGRLHTPNESKERGQITQAHHGFVALTDIRDALGLERMNSPQHGYHTGKHVAMPLPCVANTRQAQCPPHHPVEHKRRHYMNQQVRGMVIRHPELPRGIVDRSPMLPPGNSIGCTTKLSVVKTTWSPSTGTVAPSGSPFKGPAPKRDTISRSISSRES